MHPVWCILCKTLGTFPRPNAIGMACNFALGPGSHTSALCATQVVSLRVLCTTAVIYPYGAQTLKILSGVHSPHAQSGPYMGTSIKDR